MAKKTTGARGGKARTAGKAGRTGTTARGKPAGANRAGGKGSGKSAGRGATAAAGRGTAAKAGSRGGAASKASTKASPRRGATATASGSKRATKPAAGKAKPPAKKGPTAGRRAATAVRAGKAKPAAPARARQGVAATPAKGGRTGKASKVGSDKKAAANFAGRKDFGTPAAEAEPRGRGPGAAEGLPRAEQGRAGDAGDRTHGVGSVPSGVGSGSGGDLDTDFIGLGTGGSGIAQDTPTDVTEGPASTTGGSEEFASGPPAEGHNQLPPGTHGGASNRTYDSVDHTGEDASTVQGGVASDAAGTARGGIDPDDDAAAGEISSGEAGGDDNAGTSDDAGA